MNYELAKELKDAGFPQYEQNNYKAVDDATYIPTLEELIEACGERLEELSNFSHVKGQPKWTAAAYSCEECDWKSMEIGRGKTPTDAVAKLWLALNNK